MQRKFVTAMLLASSILVCASPSHATVFGELQGIVHDPDHRPIANAKVTIHAADSQLSKTIHSDGNGYFSFPALPLGNYTIAIASPGFDVLRQSITVFASNSPILHFQLQVGSIQQSVRVTSQSEVVNGNSVTPTTLISRREIARTPGADLTNSLN
ncbi:MAG: carboxypeptidase-like regulatory domain-containing protein, partial [Acidobacteriaceae bacterium]